MGDCLHCGEEIRHCSQRGSWVHVESDMRRCHQSQWCPYRAEPMLDNLTVTVTTARDPAETDRRTILIEAGLLLQLLRRLHGMPDLMLEEPLPNNVVGGIIINRTRMAQLRVRSSSFSIPLKMLE